MAPTVLLTKLEKTEEQIVQKGKMVPIPVPIDTRKSLVGALVDQHDASIIRGNGFDTPVYKGILRASLVQRGFEFLVSRSNPYFEQNEQEVGLINDVDGLASGNFAPGAAGLPTKLLELKHPYSQMMPIFFPNCTADVDDPERNPKVSESEWLIHMLRSVRKNLAEVPLFVFSGAYRLDAQRLIAACNAPIGFKRYGDGQIKKSVSAVDRFLGQTLRGSGDYYARLKMELLAKSHALGFPQLFFTFSSTDFWDVTLSTALSQDGHNVWHKNDETKRLTLIDKAIEPEENPDVYFVHVPEDTTILMNWSCPFHDDCQRVPMSKLLSLSKCKELLTRNIYNMQRIFDQRSRSLTNNILMSENNALGVKIYHNIKEFTDVGGKVHVHGVGWKKQCPTTSVFNKLHKGLAISGTEKDLLISLAESILTASLSSQLLSTSFPELSEPRAEVIVNLAAKHQIHHCNLNSGKCVMTNDSDGCKYHFPRPPSDYTIIACPLPSDMDYEERKFKTNEARKVKEMVRDVLTGHHEAGTLHDVILIDVLLSAIGDVHPNDEECYVWKHGIFPPSQDLTNWLHRIASDRDTHIALLALYHTALSISTWEVNKTLVHQLVLRREVSESYVVDYNPFCLEAMQSNMELRFVLHTPIKLIEYMTKAQKSLGTHRKVVTSLKANGIDTSLVNILKGMSEHRSVNLSEAFFRIDDDLPLSETNLPVEFVNTNFPNNRPSNYVRVDEGGVLLPNMIGRYIKTPEFLDDYSDK